MSHSTPSQNHDVTLLAIPWTLAALVTILGVYVWGSSFDWQFSGLSVYQVFPVLGLLAFSLMWSHYMVGVMQRFFLKDADLSKYFSWTGYVVLVTILLHPGLLAYQRFRDGFGLPPGSDLGYVANGMAWLIILGYVNLAIILSFELHRWFERRHWWRYILYANDVAMLGIFYHGLELGTQTHIGWFRMVWWFYGITLVAVLIFKYTRILLGLESTPNVTAADEKTT